MKADHLILIFLFFCQIYFTNHLDVQNFFFFGVEIDSKKKNNPYKTVFTVIPFNSSLLFIYFFTSVIVYLQNHIMIPTSIDTDRRKEILKTLFLQIKVGNSIAKWSKLAGRTKNRYFRFKELLMTEMDYQNDLITIRDFIKKPLRDQGIINQAQERAMFPNIDAMIQLSLQLRQELDTKFKNWNRRTTQIGKTMTKFSKFMLVYSDYFKNLSSNQEKIKLILKQNEKAQLIQKNLSTPNKIITIQDLISKPFQRPLKYHLILRDYESKTPKDHPDSQNLKQAIECYHKVNEQNNESMQNKQKNQFLISLDNKYGNIIQEGARTYIAQFQSILIDSQVDLYLFSDLLLVAFKGKNSSAQPLRIYLDKCSYVYQPGDGHYFINRVFLFGVKRCIHLTFIDRHIRDTFFNLILTVVNEMKINEATRQEKMNQRATRATKNRNTLTERRFSFTQLKPQTKRPLVITVIGSDQRAFAQDRVQTYYVLRIHVTSKKIINASPTGQISLVPSQHIQKIQQILNKLYPQFVCLPIDYCPKGFVKRDFEKDKDKKFEVQSIFIELMLNSIFRDATTTKRLDIFAYYLGISDTLWQHLKVPNTCALRGCLACIEIPKYKTYEEYFFELRKRHMEKYKESSNRIFQSKGILTLFCQRKTVNMQQSFQYVPAQILKSEPLQSRLQWTKNQLGMINHLYTNSKPISTRLSAKIYYCNISSYSDAIEIEFNSSQRVKHIINYVGERLKINLQDYTLLAYIGNCTYLLHQDEQMGKILIPPPKQTGLFSSFFAKQPFKINFWLRKIWFFDFPLEIKCSERKLHLKTEEFIFRIKYGEIRLRDMRQYSEVYAWYYCFKHFIELDTLSYYIIKKRTEELDRLLPDRMREKILDSLYAQIEKIKCNKTITNQNQLAQMILKSIIDDGIGYCYFYQTVLKPDNIKVRIGCDYHGIKVKDRSSLLFEFKFEQNTFTYTTNGCQLLISDDKPYIFYSFDSWKIKEQIDLYQCYYNKFCKK